MQVRGLPACMAIRSDELRVAIATVLRRARRIAAAHGCGVDFSGGQCGGNQRSGFFHIRINWVPLSDQTLPYLFLQF